MGTERPQAAAPWAGGPQVRGQPPVEELLRDSEQRYRSLIRATAQIVWATDPDGRVDEPLPTWTAFTGQADAEARGAGWLGAIHPDDRASVAAAWSAAVAARTPFEADYRLRHRDGSYRFVLARGVPVIDARGGVREWVGTCTDLTERKRVEQELREENRVAEALYQVGQSLVGELDPAALAQTVVDAAARTCRAEFGAFRYADARHALAAGTPEAFAQLPIVREASIFRRDAAVRMADVTADARHGHDGELPVRSFLAVPVASRSGQVIGGLFLGHGRAAAFGERDARAAAGIAAQAAVALDNARLFQESRDAQSRLARQLDYTRSITHSLGEGLYAVDAEGRVTFLNPEAERLLGWTEAELLGRGMHEMIHYRHADGSPFPRERCPLLRVMLSGEPIRAFEDAFIRKDGSDFPVSYTSSPTVADGRVVGAVVAFHDITQRKWAEQTLRRSRDELERLVDERTAALREANARLEASNRELQDFASVASHDLQEPLRKIQAFGDRLMSTSAATLGPDGADYLRRMQAAALRMQTLINDLLAFARVTTRAQPFQPVDLGRVFDEVLVDLEARIEQQRATIERGPLPTVDADPMQMRQLFQNLAGNALKFVPPDVRPLVRIWSEADGGGEACRVCVADNGIGFDEKYLDRIFNVFQRLHGRGVYEGTGIGLAVCRKIAERHGGSITARSRPGAGATFVVTLPLRQAAAPTRGTGETTDGN